MNNLNKRGGMHHKVTAQTNHSANTDIESAFCIKSFCVAKRFPYKGNTDRYWSLRLSTLLK